MSKVSDETVANTRKNAARIQSQILRRLAEVTQDHAAKCIGVDASTLSRRKESIEDASQILAALGFQIFDEDSMVLSRDDVSAYKRLAYKYLKLEVGEEGV